MKHRFHFNRILLITCLTILVLLTVYSFANAQDRGDKPTRQVQKAENEESRDVTVPGGPGFISIPPEAFMPFSPVMEWSYSDNALYNPSTTKELITSAPVYLPHGAIINQVILYWYDNSEADDLNAELYKRPFSDLLTYPMASVDSSSLFGGWGYTTDTTINNATIDNQNYIYHVSLYLPKNGLTAIRFKGLRIDYEYPGYLPCVTK